MFIELKWYDRVLLLLHTDDGREKSSDATKRHRKSDWLAVIGTTRASRTFAHTRTQAPEKLTDDERREKKMRATDKHHKTDSIVFLMRYDLDLSTDSVGFTRL
uniref:(northern house mosquito) hypothetical protein n=1 Tax=Culex pipiens TaxID=7175 RepID=A0A8D8J466_CULPI